MKSSNGDGFTGEQIGIEEQLRSPLEIPTLGIERPRDQSGRTSTESQRVT